MTSDGDELAPVTWLFGPPEPATAATAEPVRGPSGAPDALVERATVGSQSRSNSRDEPTGRFEQINNVSMHALARRGIAAEEMADYLLRRGFDDGEVELECERLLRVGLLDDVALAETLVRTLRERKGLGRSALVAELRRRKLDRDAIEEALEALDTDDELVRATELAVRRAPQLRSLDPETARRRLGAFLMRKGYAGSVVSAAVSQALQPSSGPVFR